MTSFIPDEIIYNHIVLYLNKSDIIKAYIANPRFKNVIKENLETIITNKMAYPDKTYINKCFEYFYHQSYDKNNVDIFEKIVHFISSQSNEMHEDEFNIYQEYMRNQLYDDEIDITRKFYYDMRVLYNFPSCYVFEMHYHDIHLITPQWIQYEEDILYVYKCLFVNPIYEISYNYIKCILINIYSITCLDSIIAFLTINIPINIICKHFFEIDVHHRLILTKMVLSNNVDIETATGIIKIMIKGGFYKKNLIELMEELEIE